MKERRMRRRKEDEEKKGGETPGQKLEREERWKKEDEGNMDKDR